MRSWVKQKKKKKKKKKKGFINFINSGPTQDMFILQSLLNI